MHDILLRVNAWLAHLSQPIIGPVKASASQDLTWQQLAALLAVVLLVAVLCVLRKPEEDEEITSRNEPYGSPGE